MSTQQTTHHLLTGVTVGGGALEWLSVNSSAVTVIIVMMTGVASIAIGIWNARSNSRRNQINKRNIVNDIIEDLEKGGKSDDYISDLIESMKK